MKKLLCLGCLLLSLNLFAQQLTSRQYKEDFDYFWTTINDNYSYWDKKQTDWQKVKTLYSPVADTISSRESFVLFLEKVFYEIYDHHASLNTNTMRSQRLVPSGADIWAEYVNGRAVIMEIKKGSGADRAGMRPGMQVIALNGQAIEEAANSFLALSLKKPDAEAANYSLRVALAGNHKDERKITVNWQGKQQDFYPDRPVNLLEARTEKPAVESKLLQGNIGYILLNNDLGDNGMIPGFDSAVASLANTKGLILDMRNTPSGGNTTVARAILGKFISKEGFYQKHELTSEEKETGVKRSWEEIVSPRQPVYTKPLTILVDHWTGSIAEGITIGFDGLKRGTILGTRMAALNGAVYSFEMPNSRIVFSFPAERLYHINGLPREKYKPNAVVDLSKQAPGEDLILKEAVKRLK